MSTAAQSSEIAELLRGEHVHCNLPPAKMIEYAIRRGEGKLADTGALVCFTGSRTGRSPQDRFIVKNAEAAHVDWNDINQPCSEELFDAVYNRVMAFLRARGELFGPGNAQLPLPPMLMFDRISTISETGGPHGKGQVAAELKVAGNSRTDWFFHCHLLYHLKAGMARVVHYDGYRLYPELAAVRPRLYEESWYIWGAVTPLSNMAEAAITASNTRNIVRFWGEIGWKEEARQENRWETTLTWDRWFNRFFTVFIGVDRSGRRSDAEYTRGVLGFTYLLPLNFARDGLTIAV